jgi:hypothetical protein
MQDFQRFELSRTSSFTRRSDVPVAVDINHAMFYWYCSKVHTALLENLTEMVDAGMGTCPTRRRRNGYIEFEMYI